MRRLLLALPLLVLAGAGESPERLYVGRQVVEGVLRFPVLGEVETEVTYEVLARVTTKPSGVTLEQQACRVGFKDVLGVGTRIPDASIQRLPPDRVVYRPGPDGWLFAEAWESGWGASDVDGDGEPGLTVHVDAPLCGGRLQVTSKTRARARARWSGEVLEGEVRLKVSQGILGASNACLELVSSDTEQAMRGRFTYRPAPPQTTCADVVAR